MSRRSVITSVIGICILSATVGSGITLLAKTGPTGPTGPRGPVGPEGRPGTSAEDAKWEAEEALSRVDELEGQLSDLESRLPMFGGVASEDDLRELEWSIEELESTICQGAEFVC